MDDTLLLLDLVKQGDKKARDTLVEENLGLVRHVVKRFLSWGYEPEELFQVGCIGLMKAIDKFDTTYQVQFSTYAVPLIQGEIRRFLRDDGMVKVSRSIRENGWKLQKIRNELIVSLGVSRPCRSCKSSATCPGTTSLWLSMRPVKWNHCRRRYSKAVIRSCAWAIRWWPEREAAWEER